MRITSKYPHGKSFENDGYQENLNEVVFDFDPLFFTAADERKTLYYRLENKDFGESQCR